MRLTRPAAATGLISLVPMIDVLLILLVFFMVTSSYLNLDMIPARSPQGSAGPASDRPVSGATMMVRIGADGQIGLRGRLLDGAQLRAVLDTALAEEPQTRLLILPSGAATTQALISVLDIAAAANVQQLQVLRLEGRP